MQSIVNQYAEAYEEVKENLAHCNNLLGYSEEKCLPLSELRKFFTIFENRETNGVAYQLFLILNQKILEKERKLDEYCSHPIIYRQYVREYYSNQSYYEGFCSRIAFQSNAQRSSANTSMIDIAARCKKQTIIIYQQQNNQWNEIYRTEDQKGESLSIEYRPTERAPFVALRPNPKYSTAIKSMLLTQFGLFQKSSTIKSDDDHSHSVSKIICEYL